MVLEADRLHEILLHWGILQGSEGRHRPADDWELSQMEEAGLTRKIELFEKSFHVLTRAGEDARTTAQGKSWDDIL